tara:strand:- start:203 stop:322 length:120 start_codon:yes stop_codon:yes gene_type:complete
MVVQVVEAVLQLQVLKEDQVVLVDQDQQVELEEQVLQVQ